MPLGPLKRAAAALPSALPWTLAVLPAGVVTLPAGVILRIVLLL